MLGVEYVSDLYKIIRELEEKNKSSMLEEIIQNPLSVANCFINGEFKYFPKTEIPVAVLNNFLKLLKIVSNDKNRIINNNL